MATARLPLATGIAAVRHARSEVERAVDALDPLTVSFDAALAEPRGAFVTLWRPGRELRGCIGVIEPRASLAETIADAAASVVADPRFEPLAPRELREITVEVSVLTPPVPLALAYVEELPSAVRVGEHGLIVRAGRHRGLLLPQVATDHGFTASQFLSATCLKAGLAEDAWRDASLRLAWSVFGAQVFGEIEPRGEVIEETPGGERAEVA